MNLRKRLKVIRRKYGFMGWAGVEAVTEEAIKLFKAEVAASGIELEGQPRSTIQPDLFDPTRFHVTVWAHRKVAHVPTSLTGDGCP